MISFYKLYDFFEYEDNTMILLFGLSLCDNANQWFQNLSRKGPMSWKDFTAQFLRRFHHMWHTPFADLLKITQGPTESFDKYIDRWFGIVDQIHHNVPPLEELIRLAIRSAQPSLNELLAIHTISDFKELKAVGENYEKKTDYPCHY
jgi:Retrotransposon gag protein